MLASSVLLTHSIGAARADATCRRLLAERIKACADQCVARAKAAVDPAIRDRVKGYGCLNNCTKLEVFSGNTCPDDHATR